MMFLSVSTTASAEEANMNALQTALSSTTVSGYVDTSVQWSLTERGAQIRHGRNFRNLWQAIVIWLQANPQWYR